MSVTSEGANGNDLTASTAPAFWNGVQAGIPVAIGYIPIALAFGLLARSAGVPDLITCLMSFLVFSGSGQFVGVSLLAIGTATWEIVLTTFILNLRLFLMSASLSQRIADGTTKKQLALLSYGIIDETFSVASMRPEKKLAPSFLYGLNLTAYLAWCFGTIGGVFLAAGLPASVQASIGISLYAMFIALLVPTLRNSPPVLAIAGLAVLFHSILHWVPLFAGLSVGWTIMISTLLAALIGAALFPKGVEAS